MTDYSFCDASTEAEAATRIHPELREYVEHEILPRYDHFDQAHQRDHALMVIRQSLEIAAHLEVDMNMVYAIAAYHDTGLCEGRELHHVVSARIIRSDKQLQRWFAADQIEVMAAAAEDHRASAKQAPRTVYGRIVAEADRFIDPVTIIQRTIQFGLYHYPNLTREEHYQRMVAHLNEKYGRNGYLKLWFTESPNTARLEKLRQLIDDGAMLRKIFDENFGQ